MSQSLLLTDLMYYLWRNAAVQKWNAESGGNTLSMSKHILNMSQHYELWFSYGSQL